MLSKKSVLFISICLVLFLPACALGDLFGGNDIVGRWECFLDTAHTKGAVYELYSDDTGATYNFNSPADLEFPLSFGPFAYTFSASTGVLEVTPTDVPVELARSFSYDVTFLSKDEITMDGPIILSCLRAPLPEIPIGVRARVAPLLLDKDRTLISLERIKGDWRQEYPAYTAPNPPDPQDIAQDPEEWVVVFQVAGESQDEVFLIVEGVTYQWELVRLEPAD